MELKIDFLTGPERTRLRTATRGQPLAKAVGIRDGLCVLDATAGLGRDALFLARLGAEVIALERNPILAQQLQEALSRAVEDAAWLKAVGQPPVFLLKDFLDSNLNLPWIPDVVYLDPMFPHTEKSALPKGEIQTLRKLLGSQDDIEEMLKKALSLAKERVVLKRPSEVEPLLKPTHSFEAKLVRFDMYVRPQASENQMR